MMAPHKSTPGKKKKNLVSLRKEDADLKLQAVGSDAGDVTGCLGRGMG